MKKISELFVVKYGVNFELNTLKVCSSENEYAVHFVSRTSKNNGVSSIVERIADAEPLPAGTISVACGGSVLEAFLQPKPYYSGRDLFYLTPKVEMSDVQKLYYCSCIRANKYRYNYGRQANKTLKDILIPDFSEIPEFIKCHTLPDYSDMILPAKKGVFEIDVSKWKPFRYNELFVIERGTGPRKQDISLGEIPFVTSTDANNGVSAFCDHVPTHSGNTITVNRNGSVGEAFYQENSFCSTEDVHIFNPKFDLNKYIAMFFISLFRKEKYRYNYGRKWGIDRMNNSIIKLPVTPSGKPDYAFMEQYIKSLSYSSAI